MGDKKVIKRFFHFAGTEKKAFFHSEKHFSKRKNQKTKMAETRVNTEFQTIFKNQFF